MLIEIIKARLASGVFLASAYAAARIIDVTTNGGVILLIVIRPLIATRTGPLALRIVTAAATTATATVDAATTATGAPAADAPTTTAAAPATVFAAAQCNASVFLGNARSVTHNGATFTSISHLLARLAC
jgi:hypothetical protein